MAGAHRVAVELFHCNHISHHVGTCHRLAALWVMIVSVDAAHRDALIVDPNLTVLDSNAAKAGDQGGVFTHRPEQLDHYPIAVWIFG
jgi:hypothetical protein